MDYFYNVPISFEVPSMLYAFCLVSVLNKSKLIPGTNLAFPFPDASLKKKMFKSIQRVRRKKKKKKNLKRFLIVLPLTGRD